MSQANVEVVRATFERWNAGDHSVPTEYLDPSVELESALSSVSGEPYRGHAGFEEWIRDLDDHRLTRVRIYLDPAEALKAVGLVE